MPLGQQALAAAEAGNIAIDVIPFIRTEPLPINVPGKVNVVIFTSANAVQAAQQALSNTAMTVYCMEGATAALVTECFGKAVIAGVARNASSLADLIIIDQVQEAVFCCGDQRRPELPEKLSRHGVNVNEIITYRTILTPVQVNKQYNGMLFFSPSAVKSFFSVNGVHKDTVLFAIGETTARAIEDACPNKVITGHKPGKDALALEAIQYLSEKSKVKS